MDALVSDYSSKDRPSIGQKTRWLVPAVERPARRIFAPSITPSRGNSEHLSTLLRVLANTSICLPEIEFANQNYSGCVEPLRAAIEYCACLIDTAGEYATEEIVGRAIQDQRDRVFLGANDWPLAGNLICVGANAPPASASWTAQRHRAGGRTPTRHAREAQRGDRVACGEDYRSKIKRDW